ncbi:MAG: antibiotic biosynthesis monooxygenase [Anaerolineae bacterium]|nr:antibiotic biosynthesis monooxygenase [Anaerolineae bacterium]
MSKLALIIKTRTKAGKRDEVRGLYEQLLAPRALTNPAQELVLMNNDAQDPNVFYLFEVYANQEAFQASSQAPWFWEYRGAAEPLLEGRPEVVMAVPVWGKGISI